MVPGSKTVVLHDVAVVQDFVLYCYLGSGRQAGCFREAAA